MSPTDNESNNKFKLLVSNYTHLRAVVFMVVFALTGTTLLLASHAAPIDKTPPTWPKVAQNLNVKVPSAVFKYVSVDVSYWNNKTIKYIDLTWTPAHDNVKVDHYVILKGGEYIRVPGNVTHYHDTDVQGSCTGGQPYTYYCDYSADYLAGYDFTITAFDAAGNHSQPTSNVTVYMPLVRDTSPPTWPIAKPLFFTSATRTQINMTWVTAKDNFGVYEYDIQYDGGVADFQLSDDHCHRTVCGPAINYTATGLVANFAPGTKHTFRVQAMDSSGNYSVWSNTITASTKP